MPRDQFQNLTEPMYYILLALLDNCCGVDIMALVTELSQGRVHLGPGTLYTLLSRFEQEEMIEETDCNGRKRWYRITEKGKKLLLSEHARLQSQWEDGVRRLEGRSL